MTRTFCTRRHWLLLAALGLLAGLALLAAPPHTQAQDTTSRVYFPQTGHFLSGEFRRFWEAQGGVDIFGFPITEEYIQASNGTLVQYFERARFELGSQNGQPIIELGMIGEEFLRLRGQTFPPSAAFADTPNRRYFPETQQGIQGAFKAFWDARGSGTLFGMPISPELEEVLPDGQRHLVQYFQRARFELRGGTVILGSLGRFLAPCQQLIPRPPDLPPSGPLPEGDNSGCLNPNAVAIGRVFPTVAAPGEVLGFEARNYLPGEEVGLWYNLPDGSTRGLPYRALADENGAVLIGLLTNEDDLTGGWSLVGQGLASERVVISPFELRR